MFDLVSQTGHAKCTPGKGVLVCSFCNLISQVLAAEVPSPSTKWLSLSSSAITPAQPRTLEMLSIPTGIPTAKSWEEQGLATYETQEICLKTTHVFNGNIQALAPLLLNSRTGAGCSAWSGGRATPAMPHFQSCQWWMEGGTSSLV